jgi:predicted nucleic acid-binding protein
VRGIKPIVYVDACVFIAMLTGEQRQGDESAQVAGFAKELEVREVIAVTSTITRTEILDCTLTTQQRGVMERLIRPPKVQVKDVSTPITEIAHEIRSFYQQLKLDGKTELPTVETPDALHLATAIHYSCPTFFTFDEKDKTGKDGGKAKRGLIPLSPVIAGKYPLVICKPYAKALGLPYV